MVKKTLTMVLVMVIVLTSSSPVFSDGDQQAGFEQQQQEEVDTADGASAWQGGEYVSDWNNQLSHENGSGTSDSISSLADLALQLCFEYLMNQVQ